LSSQIDRSKVEYVKEIADPELVASSLGVHFYGHRGRYLRAACPVHNGDNKTAFSLDIQTGAWACFTEGCHHGYSDIIGLVELVRRCNFIEAIKYIAALSGINLDNSTSDDVAGALYRKDVRDFVNRTNKVHSGTDLGTIINIEEQIHGWVTCRSDYFTRRGYTPSILDYFEIGSSYDARRTPREIIPIRDMNGRVVALDGRRTDSDENPRYLINPPGFAKGGVLYHYHKAKDYIAVFQGKIFVVEGYKACWSMVQAGYLNTVACMGAGFHGQQAGVLLQNMSLQKVIVVLDGDIAGRNGARRTKSELNHLCEISMVDMPEGEDPSTLPPNVLHSLLYPHIN